MPVLILASTQSAPAYDLRKTCAEDKPGNHVADIVDVQRHSGPADPKYQQRRKLARARP